MKHLTDTQIALLATGDLGFLEYWRVRHHLSVCGRCKSLRTQYRVDRDVLKDAADQMPEGVNWERLSREMRGNIRVGLEAGECVAQAVVRPEPMGWRMAVALSSAMAVVLTGWYLSAPKFASPAFASLSSQGTVIEATPSGVLLQHDGHGISLMSPRANHVQFSIDTRGAKMQAVDVETGQVTITQVSLSSEMD